MFLSLNKKWIVSLIACMATIGAVSTADASPIGCTMWTNPTQVTWPGTLDYCETTPASYCFSGTLCCGVSFPTQISQNQFNDYRTDFIMDSFYVDTVTPDFKDTTDEARNVALLKMTVWGTFLDASVLMDTLKDLNFLNAQAVQTYVPSEQICKIGTLSRALSASEAKVDADRLVMGEVGLVKNLGRSNSISSAGNGQENQARIRVFVEKFCDVKDNNSGLDEACQLAPAISDLQFNRDIDYTRLMGNGVTINADLTDSNSTQDETNLIAMSHFLYGHRQPSKRISLGEFAENTSTANLYAEYRSVAARRSAAQNSYNTLAAMKMAGSGSSETYIRDMMRALGVDGGDADRYLGAQNKDYTFVETSYNAQMNLLTKQVYQDPAFYANLMDSKVNVKRTSAALQGIGLMQQRDTYKSMARSEMLAALLVELEARQIANNVQSTKTK